MRFALTPLTMSMICTLCVCAVWGAHGESPPVKPRWAAMPCDLSDKAACAARFKVACEVGEVAGCTALALAYHDGEGVVQSDAEAHALILKACEGGDARGCSIRGLFFAHGYGVSQDLVLASTLYAGACERGYMTACHNLGLLYADGEGVAQDLARAVALQQQACDGGEMTGCSALGVAYQVGEGVAQDTARAESLLIRACDGANDAGCYALAVLYADALEARISEATDLSDVDLRHVPLIQKYFGAACEDGHAPGCYNLGLFFERTGSPARALAPHTSACALDHGKACWSLAILYTDGDGVAPDAALRVEFNKKACALGVAQACASTQTP